MSTNDSVTGGATNADMSDTGETVRQLNSLLAAMGLGGTHNARVTVKVTGGQGRVTAYAATIDALTQDPTFIPAQ